MAATDPTPALRVALEALLLAGGGITMNGQPVPIWDGVAQAMDGPAVIIIEGIELGEALSKDGTPRQADVDISIVVDGRSRHDCELLCAAVHDRLNDALPAVATHTTDRLICTYSRTESAGDEGLTHVGRQGWRLWILS